MYTVGNNLNRSCSESDLFKVNSDNTCVQDHYGGFEKKVPLVRKRFLFVEEVIDGESPGFLRSGSCCEIIGRSVPDHLHNLENLFATSVVLNNTTSNAGNIFNSGANTQLNVPKTRATCLKNDGVMPMEVDTSPTTLRTDPKTEDCVDFIETMDIDVDSCTNKRLRNLDNVFKKRHKKSKKPETTHFDEWSSKEKKPINNTEIIPIKQLKNKETRNNNCIYILVIAFLSLLLYILLFHNIHLSVNSEIQLQHIEKDLQEQVYGQKASINVVIRSLRQREHWRSKIKVLGFIGSAGVGKTLVANLIKKHFHPWLIHELYGIQLSYKSQWDQILRSLQACCLNLIIIDDLKKKDATDLFALIHSLPQNQFILVISIFNIQYSNDKLKYTVNSSDIVDIRNEFDNSDLYHEIIVFEEFTGDQVKDWIGKQLKLQNVEFSLQQKLVEIILEGHNTKHHGLKGLRSKMLLELEKYNR